MKWTFCPRSNVDHINITSGVKRGEHVDHINMFVMALGQLPALKPATSASSVRAVRNRGNTLALRSVSSVASSCLFSQGELNFLSEYLNFPTILLESKSFESLHSVLCFVRELLNLFRRLLSLVTINELVELFLLFSRSK